MAPRHPPYALSSLTIQLTKNIYVPSLVNSSLLSHRLEVPCHLINNKVFFILLCEVFKVQIFEGMNLQN